MLLLEAITSMKPQQRLMSKATNHLDMPSMSCKKRYNVPSPKYFRPSHICYLKTPSPSNHSPYPLDIRLATFSLQRLTNLLSSFARTGFGCSSVQYDLDAKGPLLREMIRRTR